MFDRMKKYFERFLKDDQLHSKLALGAIIAFTVNVAGTGTNFLAHLVLGRSLGVEGYGIFAYVMAWVAILSTISQLGFTRTLVRFVSIYKSQQDWERLRGITQFAQTNIIIAGTAVLLVGMISIFLAKERLGLELYWAFFVGLFAIPILALATARGWILRGLGHVLMAILPLNVIRPMVLLLLTAGCYYFGVVLGPVLAIGIGVFSISVCLIVVSIVIANEFSAIGNVKGNIDAKKEWRHSANTLLVFACLQTLLGQLGVLVLGWLSGSADAGVFAVAQRMADLAQFPLVAINVIVAPTIARLHAQGDKAALQRMVTTTARWVAMASLCISIPFLIVPEFFLDLFGSDFVAGATTLRIVLVGQLIQACAGSVNNLIIMSGHHTVATSLLASAVVGNLVLAVVLLPLMGIEGVGLARCLAISGMTISAVYLAWQRLGIVPSVFGTREHKR